jgi:hypothetical protein
MANVNKTDIVYWLGKIFEVLGGDKDSRVLSEINVTNVVYWLEQIYNALGGADKPHVVEGITEMTAAQLDALKPGDVIAKKTGNMYHTYMVSYKGEGEGQGICLTYVAAGLVETVSYDRTETGWAYNSTDVTPIS